MKSEAEFQFHINIFGESYEITSSTRIYDLNNKYCFIKSLLSAKECSIVERVSQAQDKNGEIRVVSVESFQQVLK